MPSNVLNITSWRAALGLAMLTATTYGCAANAGQDDLGNGEEQTDAVDTKGLSLDGDDAFEFKTVNPVFTVKTSNVSGAGTDAHVWIWVHAATFGWQPNGGANPGWNLNKDNFDDFEQDALTTYTIDDALFGDVDQIFLVRDNVGTNPEWRVDYVDTRSLHGNTLETEHCNIQAWVTTAGVFANCGP